MGKCHRLASVLASTKGSQPEYKVEAVTDAMRGSEDPYPHKKRPEAWDEAKASAPRGVVGGG